MQVQQCMFCFNKTGRLFLIFSRDYGNSKHTIRDDLIEFFGDPIEQFLKCDDVLCNLCMNILENMTKLKRRLMPLIIDRRDSPDVKPVKFGKMWDIFANHLDFEDDDQEMSMCSSPANLLKYSHSQPYHSLLESQIAEREHMRSLSRASSYCYSDTSTNREVAGIFNTRKKRKRKGKKNLWTRRKTRSRTRRNSSSSVRTNCISSLTNYSNDSDCSYQIFYGPQSRNNKRSSSVKSEPILKYDGDILLNKKTRSVSRIQQREADKIAQRESEIYRCSENNCYDFFESLDDLTDHKVNKHKKLLCFPCDYYYGCDKKYTCKEDLKAHRTNAHEKEDRMKCPLCDITDLEGMGAFQEHIEDHKRYSVPCLYCDKYFLDETARKDHVKANHKGKKKPIKLKKPQEIIYRVDKPGTYNNKEQTESKTAAKVPFENKEFIVRYMIQQTKSKDEEESAKEIRRIHQKCGGKLSAIWSKCLIENTNQQAQLQSEPPLTPVIFEPNVSNVDMAGNSNENNLNESINLPMETEVIQADVPIPESNCFIMCDGEQKMKYKRREYRQRKKKST